MPRDRRSSVAIQTFLRARAQKSGKESGSTLLASMIVIILLSVAAAGVLSYSSTNYRNSLRQALLDQAKDLAESEMQYLYFSWKTALLQNQTFSTVAGALVTSGISSSSTGTPTSTGAPFPTNMQSLHNATTWTVGRSLTFNAIPNTTDGGATGIVPNTKTTGHNYYYSAYTSATITDPVVGSVTFHAGRHFVFSSTSLFQYAIFYQGDLELAAGSNMTINGPLLTNGNAYIASQAADTVVIQDKIYYHGTYNGSADAFTSGSDLNGTETFREPGLSSSGLVAPIFNPDPTSAAPSDQNAQRALQVVQNQVTSSFLGGVNPGTDIAEYPDAYKDLSGTPNANEVYRAVIAPPPTANDGSLISEDPVVAAARMYNRAGLLITVNQSNLSDPSTITVHIGNSSNPSLYDNKFSAYMASIVPSKRLAITDKRENGTINVTTLDVGALNTALTTLVASDTTIASAYNGVVYMYDNTNGGVGNGILVKNASTTPNFSDSSGNPMGFTVASNNGVYVQGDFNTTPITIGGTSGQTNPSAILGDAITALSEGWQPANSALPYQNRQATASTTTNALANGTDGTHGGLTINAAILTGNTPTNGTLVSSGGAQNLVRYLEDWWDPNLEVKLNGSIGQLFTSKYFTGAYTGLMANGDHVYYQPRVRNLNYDSSLASRPPALSPKTTSFSLGDYFFW